jgi:hypothetical protein
MHKKTGPEVRFFKNRVSSCSKFYWIRYSRLGCLEFGQGLANHILGQACTFTTLRSDAGGFPDFPIAAAAVVDCIADLTIGDTFAEADVHREKPSR